MSGSVDKTPLYLPLLWGFGILSDFLNKFETQIKVMAKHHPDLVFCRKQPGIALGRLCEKHDGQCVICDSYVRPHVLVRICDECNYGSFEVNFS